LPDRAQLDALPDIACVLIAEKVFAELLATNPLPVAMLYAKAAQMLGVAEAPREAVGSPLSPSWEAVHEQLVSTCSSL